LNANANSIYRVVRIPKAEGIPIPTFNRVLYSFVLEVVDLSSKKSKKNPQNSSGDEKKKKSNEEEGLFFFICLTKFKSQI